MDILILNIILKPGETADIKGRVVNQNGKPLQLYVYLTYKKSDDKLRVRSDINTGSYEFEGVSPGEAFVSAKSLEISVSNSFKISESDDLDLPDLVLTYTNAAYVIINFKLPDGSFSAHARIIDNNI